MAAIGSHHAPPREASHVRLNMYERLGLAAVALACLSVLIIASTLTPSSVGYGTHSQLGLPPCGWVVRFGKPCLTCGMTTAFAAAAHVQPMTSIRAQPMGAALAVVTALLVWLAGYSAITGSLLLTTIVRLAGWKLAWISLGGLLAAWAYKWFTFGP